VKPVKGSLSLFSPQDGPKGLGSSFCPLLQGFHRKTDQKDKSIRLVFALDWSKCYRSSFALKKKGILASKALFGEGRQNLMTASG